MENRPFESSSTDIQQPINSGFSASSTALDVMKGIDLSGKTIIVTGGYSGIGIETVRAFSVAGARVIIPPRDINRAALALKGIDNLEFEVMELMEPASIEEFTRKFLASDTPLHLLVNSAGIMGNPLERDSRGNESQLSTNHLGHFQLTLQLWPALKKAKGARVIAISSRGHRFSPFVFEDPNYESRAYDAMQAYGQSKTANILFALELDKRGKADGIRSFSVHPGTIIETNLGKHMSKDALVTMGIINQKGEVLLDPLRQIKTVEQGASTGVWCATSNMLDGLGGVYCENNDIATVQTSLVAMDPLTGADLKGNFGVLGHAINSVAALKLWTLSEQLTGVTIPE